jgi:hypothetical protein
MILLVVSLYTSLACVLVAVPVAAVLGARFGKGTVSGRAGFVKTGLAVVVPPAVLLLWGTYRLSAEMEVQITGIGGFLTVWSLMLGMSAVVLVPLSLICFGGGYLVGGRKR